MRTESVVVDVSQDWVVACGVSSHCRFVRPRRPGGSRDRGEPSAARMLAHRSIRDLIYGVFDENTRTLQYVNAGHNAAMVIRRGDPVTRLEASAPPVGFFAETVYQGQVVQLYPGDFIVACTDGIVEATNTAGEEWGVEGPLAIVKGCRTRQPESIVEAAFAALDEFSGDNQTDDTTILAALVH